MLVPIISRWLHIICACLFIGGIYFFRFILPHGLTRGFSNLDDITTHPILLSLRKYFKRILHAAIGLLILTGIYNSYVAWGKYQLDPPILHSLWGTHVLFALLAMLIALVVFARPQPSPSHSKWLALTFAILLLAVAAASSLKSFRERAVAQNASNSIAPTTTP